MAIITELGLEISKFLGNFKKAEDKVKDGKKKMKESGKDTSLFGDLSEQFNKGFSTAALTSSLKGMLPAVGIGATAIGIKEIADACKELNNEARQLAVTTEELQQLKNVADTAGVSAQGLVGNFKQLEVLMRNMQGGSATKILKEYGLTAETMMRMPVDEKIRRLSQALEDARESGRGYTDIMRLIGKGGDELSAVMLKTSEELNGALNVPVASDDAIQTLREFSDGLVEMTQRIKALATEVAAFGIGVGKFIKDLYLEGPTKAFTNIRADEKRRADDSERAKAEKRVADEAGSGEKRAMVAGSATNTLGWLTGRGGNDLILAESKTQTQLLQQLVNNTKPNRQMATEDPFGEF